MIVKKILYSKTFAKEFKKLPLLVQEMAVKTEEIFKSNPLHPSLRLHQLKGSLKGLWSVSITLNYRIIFERMENGDIIFISIGKHDIYRNL